MSSRPSARRQVYAVRASLTALRESREPSFRVLSNMSPDPPFGPSGMTTGVPGHSDIGTARVNTLRSSAYAPEFPPPHHRSAPRRLSRLLWASGAQDAAYRLDRRARHALRSILCG